MAKVLYIIAGCNGAGKIMLLRIDELLSQNVSFSIETTLATRSYVKLIERAHAKDYIVTLLFFWLSSPEMAVQRVAERVAGGGHSIDKDVILRRYKAGIRNLKELYMDKVDSWTIVDNSTNPRKIIADDLKIYDPVTYNHVWDAAGILNQ